MPSYSPEQRAQRKEQIVKDIDALILQIEADDQKKIVCGYINEKQEYKAEEHEIFWEIMDEKASRIEIAFTKNTTLEKVELKYLDWCLWRRQCPAIKEALYRAFELNSTLTDFGDMGGEIKHGIDIGDLLIDYLLKLNFAFKTIRAGNCDIDQAIFLMEDLSEHQVTTQHSDNHIPFLQEYPNAVGYARKEIRMMLELENILCTSLHKTKKWFRYLLELFTNYRKYKYLSDDTLLEKIIDKYILRLLQFATEGISFAEGLIRYEKRIDLSKYQAIIKHAKLAPQTIPLKPPPLPQVLKRKEEINQELDKLIKRINENKIQRDCCNGIDTPTDQSILAEILNTRANELAAALRKNTTLTSLKLQCEPEDHVAVILGKVFAENHTLALLTVENYDHLSPDVEILDLLPFVNISYQCAIGKTSSKPVYQQWEMYRFKEEVGQSPLVSVYIFRVINDTLEVDNDRLFNYFEKEKEKLQQIKCFFNNALECFNYGYEHRLINDYVLLQQLLQKYIARLLTTLQGAGIAAAEEVISAEESKKRIDMTLCKHMVTKAKKGPGFLSPDVNPNPDPGVEDDTKPNPVYSPSPKFDLQGTAAGSPVVRCQSCPVCQFCYAPNVIVERSKEIVGLAQPNGMTKIIVQNKNLNRNQLTEHFVITAKNSLTKLLNLFAIKDLDLISKIISDEDVIRANKNTNVREVVVSIYACSALKYVVEEQDKQAIYKIDAILRGDPAVQLVPTGDTLHSVVVEELKKSETTSTGRPFASMKVLDIHTMTQPKTEEEMNVEAEKILFPKLAQEAKLPTSNMYSHVLDAKTDGSGVLADPVITPTMV